jgi:hypothetical protein
MKTIVPDAWMPACNMKRVIVHWTAGGYSATALDRAHYHIMIEKDGKLIRGTHSIADNVNTADGDYAAHVRGFNRGSIGVSMCCMAGAVESPFQGGNHPMLEVQWDAMLEVVAQLCIRYDIDVTSQTVLGHGEVERNCGVEQNGKWDPMVQPWNRASSSTEVGKALRRGVQELLDPGVPVTVVIQGKAISGDDAFMDDGRTFVALREAEQQLGWQISNAANGVATVQFGGGNSATVPFVLRKGRGYVSSSDLAEAMGRDASWEPVTRTVTIA